MLSTYESNYMKMGHITQNRKPVATFLSVDYYCELLKNHCASMMYSDTLGQYKAKLKYGQFEKEWKVHLETERKRAEELK